MKLPVQSTNPDVGFQIAPMIDVVFVILVFFMSLAAQIRIEQILQTKLPGVAVAGGPTEFVDEQILQVGVDGEITLNDESYDSPESRDLPQLTNTLGQLQASSVAAKTKLVVTLISAPDSPYYRTIDVLNALAAAGVTNVTFTAEEPEL
ncbi:MAG: biopolymer transporter ExbD [Opitutaceae bacterium]|jgi:biopolymer transport protein ExbD|nr:biopolymer transporter ExbD [Opitutaceae bacterium]